MSAPVEDNRLPLATPEALDRAMRIIYARRSGNDDLYRAELALVFQEIFEEAMAAVEDAPGETKDEFQQVYFWTLNTRSSQLMHALVRTANVLADARANERQRSAEDLLTMVDDVLREEDAGAA